SLTLSPASVVGGTQASRATVPLSAPAPSGGVQVALSSSNGAASVPSTVFIPAGASSASFTVNTSVVLISTSSTISARYNGTTRSATLGGLLAREDPHNPLDFGNLVRPGSRAIAALAGARIQSLICLLPERPSRDAMHEIQLHNTLSGKVEPFTPLKPGQVGMYTCGPTVYDYAHIGNYRTFVFQDILRRFLKWRGFKLNHVMNLTDVDDRIIANAAGAGLGSREYTEKFVQAFFTDCRTLCME